MDFRFNFKKYFGKATFDRNVQESCPILDNNGRYFNPQTSVAQKIADEVVFRRFRGEGVAFFKSDLTDPTPQIFDAHLLENLDLIPSSFHFSVNLISISCFESDGFIAYSNE